jgi:hypothetical protein
MQHARRLPFRGDCESKGSFWRWWKRTVFTFKQDVFQEKPMGQPKDLIAELCGELGCSWEEACAYFYQLADQAPTTGADGKSTMPDVLPPDSAPQAVAVSPRVPDARTQEALRKLEEARAISEAVAAGWAPPDQAEISPR